MTAVGRRSSTRLWPASIHVQRQQLANLPSIAKILIRDPIFREDGERSPRRYDVRGLMEAPEVDMFHSYTSKARTWGLADA